MRLIKQVRWFAFTLLLLGTSPVRAYSVQSHQQLVDLSWKSDFVPLLLARYPGLTQGQLREAHAYAYGGCAIQDLGYYPFGDKFFSELLHYVRTGELVQQLLADANTADELAFALGALSHYVGDSLGHSLATNDAVAVEFPTLRSKYGTWVTYDEDPHAHVQAEFAFDVNQISKGRFAPVPYLESVGLQVPVPLLARAFQETYGVPLRDVLGGSQRPNLFGYQLSVHHLLPRIAAAEAILHGKDMPPDTAGPDLDRMAQALKKSGFDNGWQKFRTAPGPGTYLLAGLIAVVPKFGPLTMLSVKGPTTQTEQDYVRSLDRSIDTMRFLLAQLATHPSSIGNHLPNRDLDTGGDVRPGSYRNTNAAYLHLLRTLAQHDRYAPSPALVNNIESFYSDRAAFGSTLNDAQWIQIQENLKTLRSRSTLQSTSVATNAQPGTQGVWMDLSSMFFDDWLSLVRVLVVGVLAYVALVVMLRISGKRTLSKMNVFDLVVTVALGSTLATILLSKSVSLAGGLLAFAMLIALQFAVAWSSVHSATVSRLVKASPRLLFYAGEFQRKAMRSERVTETEIFAAIRGGGFADLQQVGAVVLETDGSFSVLSSTNGVQDSDSALRTVRGRPDSSPEA